MQYSLAPMATHLILRTSKTHENSFLGTHFFMTMKTMLPGLVRRMLRQTSYQQTNVALKRWVHGEICELRLHYHNKYNLSEVDLTQAHPWVSLATPNSSSTGDSLHNLLLSQILSLRCSPLPGTTAFPYIGIYRSWKLDRSLTDEVKSISRKNKTTSALHSRRFIFMDLACEASEKPLSRV